MSGLSSARLRGMWGFQTAHWPGSHLPTRLNTDRRANWPLVAATGHGCRKITAFSRSGPDGRERFYETVSDIRVRRTPKITVCVGRRRLCISPWATMTSDCKQFWKRWAWTPSRVYKRSTFSTRIPWRSSWIQKVGFSWHWTLSLRSNFWPSASVSSSKRVCRQWTPWDKA